MSHEPTPPPVQTPRHWPASSRRDWRRMISTIMLVVVACWLLAIAGLSSAIFVGHFLEPGAKPYGNYITNTRTGGYFTREEWVANGVGAIVVGGLCLPTVPFVIAMAALGVALVAARDD